MRSQGQKIFIISLDGATFDVITPLVEQGYMPNIGAMISTGVSADLESVVPPVTAPAWTSFMTGKHPGKHGIFDFFRFNQTDYSWTITNAQHIQSKTLWQILDDKGKRVVVLNLPYTYPPDKISGVMVSGWDAPFTDASFAHPKRVGSDILERFPDYVSNLWIGELEPLRSDAIFEEFTSKLKIGFEQQTRIALDLLAKEPWDVFMVHFHQTDWMQHKLWTYIERGCNTPDDHSAKVEATRNCYREFDRLIGVLTKQVEPFNPATILLSDHGFGRLMGTIFPNFYLKEWGYLSARPKQEDALKQVKDLFRKSPYKPVRKLYRKVADAGSMLSKSNGVEKQHRTWTDNTKDVLSARGATWDWSQTKIAAVYAYHMAFLYVNLLDRGPRGIVRPGHEYETIVSDVIARFKNLRHPHSGEKLIQDVVRGSELYSNSNPGVLVPDVVLIPTDGYGFSFSIVDALPEVTEEGSHRHNGVLLMNGESLRIPPSNFQPDLVDLAPTVLHMAGLSVPSDMDGRVLEEVLNMDEPIRYEDVDNSVIRTADKYRPEESDLIAQRLRGLGYLE
jgi:predicted AlkP superfamily phosphohydrolase/phosphomutase